MTTEINLRILTRDKEVHEYRHVIEYVQGKLFFYVCLDDTVATHPTDSILRAVRFDEETGREWEICLKRQFSKRRSGL